MKLFFAMGAIVANLLTIGIIVIGVAGRNKDESPFEFLRGLTLWLASAVAIAAMLGSLYLSEIVDLIPCKFCWYQRIAMYPLGLITLIAALISDRGVWKYALPLAAGGAALSLYHIQLQVFPDQGGSCSISAPCNSKWVEAFGFASIPVMALMAFALTAALISMAAFAQATTETTDEL